MSKKKKIKEFDKLLRKHIKNRDVVKIYRNVTEGEANIHGVILNMTDDYLQIAETDDFEFNGEIIIRMDHFDSIRCNDSDKTYRNILKEENTLQILDQNRVEIDLTSWESILVSLKANDIHAIVECEDLKKPTFSIGAIEKINDKSVEIRNYDSTGKPDKKARKIKFKNITLLQYNDKYSTVFRKYLKKPKQKKKETSKDEVRANKDK